MPAESREFFRRGTRFLYREGFWTLIQCPDTDPADYGVLISIWVANVSGVDAGAVDVVITDYQDQILANLAWGVELAPGQAKELIIGKVVLQNGQKLQARSLQLNTLEVTASALFLQIGEALVDNLQMPQLNLQAELAIEGLQAEMVAVPLLSLGLGVGAVDHAGGKSLEIPAIDYAKPFRSTSGVQAVSSGFLAELNKLDLHLGPQEPIDAGPDTQPAEMPAIGFDFELLKQTPDEVTVATAVIANNPVTLDADYSTVPPEEIKAQIGDPLFQNVALFVNFEGVSGSQTFTDYSFNNFTLTTTGTPQISASQFYRGLASGYFDGSSNNAIDTPTSSELALSGDFTFEFSLRPNTSQPNSYRAAIELGLFTNGIFFRVRNQNDDIYVNGIQLGSSGFRAGYWTHWAIERVGSLVTVYRNGTSLYTATISGTINTSGAPLRIGEARHANNQEYAGYVDNVRLTTGVARYQANHTVPFAFNNNAEYIEVAQSQSLAYGYPSDWAIGNFQFSFTATGTGSTYGSWQANGVATINGGTFTPLSGQTSSQGTIIHSEEILSSYLQTLTVSFDCTVGNGADAFSFGILNYATQGQNYQGGVAGNAGLNGATHWIRFDFYSTDTVYVYNGGTVLGQTNTLVNGTHNWRLEYTGTTLEVYRDNTLVHTQANIVLPSSGRYAFGAGSGGSTDTVTLTNIQFTSGVVGTDLSIVANPAAATGYDADASAYMAEVELFDGQTLETPVKDAINAFYVDTKADGNYAALKAATLLMGARTRTGSYVDMITANTDLTSSNFVDTDYSRITGLKGDGSTKYLESNYAFPTNLQDSCHLSIYETEVRTTGVGIGYGDASASGSFVTTPSARLYQQSDTTYVYPDSTTPGFRGVSRDNSANFDTRYPPGTNDSYTKTSLAVTHDTFAVFARKRNGPSLDSYSDCRMTFYSAGEDVDLALLDQRVTRMVNLIQYYLYTGEDGAAYDTDTLIYVNSGYANGGGL